MPFKYYRSSIKNAQQSTAVAALAAAGLLAIGLQQLVQYAEGFAQECFIQSVKKEGGSLMVYSLIYKMFRRINLKECLPTALAQVPEDMARLVNSH